jgi:hypothetical protein
VLKQLFIRFCGVFFLWPMQGAVKAQAVSLPVSARYLGVFAYSEKQSDVFTARVNSASLAGLTQSSVGVYGEKRYGLQDLNLFNGAIGLVTRSGTIGVNASYFGFDQQNQTQLSLSYGRKVAKVVDVGASFHYLQLSQAGIYGSASAITGSFSLLMHVGNRVQVGANAYNPFRSSWGNNKEEYIPSRYSFGIGMDVSDNIFIGTEINKEENLPVDVQAAIHYSFLPQFFVRGGIATQTSNFFAALGFQLPAFRIDIAASYHQQLGWSPGLLFIARFGKQKNTSTNSND